MDFLLADNTIANFESQLSYFSDFLQIYCKYRLTFQESSVNQKGNETLDIDISMGTSFNSLFSQSER